MRYCADLHLFIAVSQRGHGHGKLVRVGADRLEVVRVGDVGVGAADESVAQHVTHGFHNVFLPEEAVAAAGAEVADVQTGHSAHARHLFPEAGLGASVEDIELELGEVLEVGAGFELIDCGEGVDLPHGCLRPRAFKAKGELAVADIEIEVGEAEVAFEPAKESRLEDAAASVEGVAGEPDHLRLVEAEFACGFQLLAKLVDVNDVAEGDVDGAVEKREGGARRGEMLPDELEHEELVEVRVKQGAGDRIQLPVVVVRAPGEVDDHVSIL